VLAVLATIDPLRSAHRNNDGALLQGTVETGLWEIELRALKKNLIAARQLLRQRDVFFDKKIWTPERKTHTGFRIDWRTTSALLAGVSSQPEKLQQARQELTGAINALSGISNNDKVQGFMIDPVGINSSRPTQVFVSGLPSSELSIACGDTFAELLTRYLTAPAETYHMSLGKTRVPLKVFDLERLLQLRRRNLTKLTLGSTGHVLRKLLAGHIEAAVKDGGASVSTGVLVAGRKMKISYDPSLQKFRLNESI
jgi:hypothetical protein